MIKPTEILIQDYDYDLPIERVALYPLEQRDESRLLCYKNNQITTSTFKNIPDYLPQGASLILNNTRVIQARILFQKLTGGGVELFCLEPEEEADITKALNKTKTTRWKCYIGGASKWKHGEILSKEVQIEGEELNLSARFVSKSQDTFTIEFSWNPPILSFAEVLDATGGIPLPPYIKRKPVQTDTDRYQTIFAKTEGSVAAPTAALHFTETVFSKMEDKNIIIDYLTLHVGAGTFKPVKTDSIAEHHMHAERFEVSIPTLKSLIDSKELIAVGTTSLRTLESLYWIGIKLLQEDHNTDNELSLGQWEAYELKNNNITYKESINAIIDFLNKKDTHTLFCQTSLLIIPGYKFHSAKALITNFHQPRSTLLLLVAAFIGEDWKDVYDYALKNEFRFLSYGDSSLLWRK